MAYRKFTMTRKRADWIGNRKVTMRGEPLRVNAQSANRYAELAMKEVRKMHLDISKQVAALFDEPIAKQAIQDKPQDITTDDVAMDSHAMDASISVKAKHLMSKLARKWNKTFNLFGAEFSKSMTLTVNKQAEKDLKKSAEKLSGGLDIKTDSLTQATKDKIISATNECSSLIKSISPEYTAEITEAIQRSISTNTGSLTSLQDTIHDALQRKYKTYHKKAKNLALDQTKKAYSNIAASRMQDIGLDKYVWAHSGGAQRPNEFHVHKLNGNTYSLSNPPVIDAKTGTKGKPGDWFGCSCYMVPVIDFG